MFPLLRDIIKSKGTTQAEVARMIGRSLTHFSHCMCGHAAFSLDEVYAISDVLGIAPKNIPLVFPDRRKYKPVDVSVLLADAGGDEK